MTVPAISSHRLRLTSRDAELSAVMLEPPGADALLVYAHGAGAPMTHAFMEASARAFAERRLSTLRFNFAYAEAGSRRPDRQPLLIEAIEAAVDKAVALSSLPTFVGGKSMGGRMSTHADLSSRGARGLILVGYPLHPAGKISRHRADNLADVPLPMLFLQGTRDKLADFPLMTRVCRELGERATLHALQGADHGFHVLKRSGRTDDEVLGELADATRDFVDGVLRR